MRWLCLMLIFPAFAFAGEDCSLVNGKCKDVCAAYEESVKGAFLDCTDKQECCVRKDGHRSEDKKVPVADKDSDQKSKTGK